MRLAVLADIHGNLPALEAVLVDLEKHDVDGVLVAGDHLTGGPNPAETMCALRSPRIWMIRGNTNNRLLVYDAGDVPDTWRTSNQWAGLRWLHRRLDREALSTIASLPEQCVIRLKDTAPIRIVHGSPRNPSEHLFPDRDPLSLRLFRAAGLLPPGCSVTNLDEAFAQIGEFVLVCGHSHIPWQQEKMERLALNPGSVGTPANGDTRAQYALLTWQDRRWKVDHRAVSYDLERVRKAYHDSGLLAEGGALARAFLLGIETGQAVLGHFVSHVHRLAAEVGAERCSVVPTDTWKRAIVTFDWVTYERQRHLQRHNGG